MGIENLEPVSGKQVTQYRCRKIVDMFFPECRTISVFEIGAEIRDIDKRHAIGAQQVADAMKETFQVDQVFQNLTGNHEVEGAVLIDQVYNPAGMADEGLKLSAVADHALVLGQSLDVLVA